jgi:hypothetical protein
MSRRRGCLGPLLIVLLGAACQHKESVLGGIHQTVDAARSRQKVQIDITTEKADASPPLRGSGSGE